VAIPLSPGYPLPDLGWSEMRYTAYSFVMPPVAAQFKASKRRLRHGAAQHPPIGGRE
jgi:hypothetical protein